MCVCVGLLVSFVAFDTIVKHCNVYGFQSFLLVDELTRFFYTFWLSVLMFGWGIDSKINPDQCVFFCFMYGRSS